jgi:hypothetical protein
LRAESARCSAGASVSRAGTAVEDYDSTHASFRQMIRDARPDYSGADDQNRGTPDHDRLSLNRSIAQSLNLI